MKLESKVHTLLFWLLAPALFAALAAPLFVGHVAVRLLIARMRRRPAALQGLTSIQVPARITRPTWRSPASHKLSGLNRAA